MFCNGSGVSRWFWWVAKAAKIDRVGRVFLSSFSQMKKTLLKLKAFLDKAFMSILAVLATLAGGWVYGLRQQGRVHHDDGFSADFFSAHPMGIC